MWRPMPQDLIKPFAEQAARTTRNVQAGTLAATALIQASASAWASKFRQNKAESANPYKGA